MQRELEAMATRITLGLLVAVLAALALAQGAGAAVIGIYRNGMDNEAQRAQIHKLMGERCRTGGSEEAFRITIGKRTRECAYRTRVIGRDLEIVATMRLLSGTPMPVQRKAFLAVNLRTGEAGAGYQLAVFPLQRKAQLRKISSDGSVEYLGVARDLAAVKPVNQANQLRLRAFNVTSGPERGSCRVVALVGRQQVADVVDPATGELEGRGSSFSVGTVGGAAKGAVASVDDVVVRVPSPFQPS